MTRKAQIKDLETLYADRFDVFLRVAASICREENLGREAVQEAFARAIESLDAFRGDAPLEAWVWRIVINTSIRSRREDREVLGETIDERSIAAGRLSDARIDRVGAHALNSSLRALPERQRLAVFLRYWADLDYRSIAHALDVEVGTVSATLNAAHRALRQSLQEVSS